MLLFLSVLSVGTELAIRILVLKIDGSIRTLGAKSRTLMF